jgi:hypothetical protein
MKLGVAQKLHASISPKDQSSTIFSRREITSDKALQKSHFESRSSAKQSGIRCELQLSQSENMECRSIILKKCAAGALSVFLLSEIIKSAY